MACSKRSRETCSLAFASVFSASSATAGVSVSAVACFSATGSAFATSDEVLADLVSSAFLAWHFR